MGNLINSGGGWVTMVMFCGNKKKHRQNREMRTKTRLSSHFCLFCGAKQAKTSPVRRLRISNYDFSNSVLEPETC